MNGNMTSRSARVFLAFLAATFIVGVAGALQTPTLSRFLTDEVQASPMAVGLFYATNAIAGIVVSFLVAKQSDSCNSRRQVVLFCCAMAIGNALTFAFTRNYLALLAIGVAFSSLASAAMPQMFAFAREYAVTSKRNVIAFNAILRAQMSLAWVIGPPLSFMIAFQYGFTTMYLCAAGMFGVAMVIIRRCLPRLERKALSAHHNELPGNEHIWGNRSIICLFLATLFMWTANIMYLIDMPLYIDNVLALSPTLAGPLMGLAAGIEIPVMLLAGALVPRWGKRNLIFIAVICGALFYIGLIFLRSEWALFALQPLNALFIGIVASIGMLYFQDLMPSRAGVASTLFNNGISCSVIVAGLMQGWIVSYWGHEMIYPMALLMTLISLIFCALVKPI